MLGNSCQRLLPILVISMRRRSLILNWSMIFCHLLWRFRLFSFWSLFFLFGIMLWNWIRLSLRHVISKIKIIIVVFVYVQMFVRFCTVLARVFIVMLFFLRIHFTSWILIRSLTWAAQWVYIQCANIQKTLISISVFILFAFGWATVAFCFGSIYRLFDLIHKLLIYISKIICYLFLDSEVLLKNLSKRIFGSLMILHRSISYRLCFTHFFCWYLFMEMAIIKMLRLKMFGGILLWDRCKSLIGIICVRINSFINFLFKKKVLFLQRFGITHEYCGNRFVFCLEYIIRWIEYQSAWIEANQ